MSDPQVTLTIDGIEVTVPKGTLLVDAAKKVGIEIPVFCYHPKLDPVGMCRMCLVEIGRPTRDRSTGELVLDEDGNPLIQFGAKLETACTTQVDEGWVVQVGSEKAIEGRKQIVEYLLTSHPLDCPICDKGGECPLQNLTMKHGPGKSRFLYDEKMHLAKHVPLGDLIYLDRERCIQCGRCIRFQDELVDDPVIEFSQRGRRLEIVTYSDPGFDSYFSGNTTDICPVGALTTADFRFGARPWELNAAASICPHCPVGCNIILNTRREAKSGGSEVVKRVMPRQNERINEIWICDKGRFAHAFATSPDRLSRPMVRVNGELVEASWEEALDAAAEGLRVAGERIVGLSGGRASNEDLYNFRLLVEGLGGVAYLDTQMAGGDLVKKVGVGSETNLGLLGEGDVVLVVASDLHEEAPIWWMRLKRAAERGTSIITANARKTRLDKYSRISLRYAYGDETRTVLGILYAASGDEALAAFGGQSDLDEAGKMIRDARNVLVFYGSEGLGYQGTHQLSLACANLLSSTGHIGKANNGLIPVWPNNNSQGGWDMGLVPSGRELGSSLSNAAALYVVATDPFGEGIDFSADLAQETFVVVQELFRTKTVALADVVFPAQSFIEREGTYTSGERVVQRFYRAAKSFGESLPDWQILARLGERLGLKLHGISAAGVMREIVKTVADYDGVDYRTLAQVEPQWPHVGDQDLYFGGTAYKNSQGTGVRLASAAEKGKPFTESWVEPETEERSETFLIIPVARLYDRGTTVLPAKVLSSRIQALKLYLSDKDAKDLGLKDGMMVEIQWDGQVVKVLAESSDDVPPGMALLPRSSGIDLQVPAPAEIKPVE